MTIKDRRCIAAHGPMRWAAGWSESRLRETFQRQGWRATLAGTSRAAAVAVNAA
jgi:hypothetical protein